MLCVLIRITSIYNIEHRKDISQLSPLASWCGTNSNLPKLELSLSRTNFHGLKGVRAIEVRLYSVFLFLDFHVKTGTRISLRYKRLFEISEVEITRVDVLWKRVGRSDFSSFPQYFQYIFNFRSQITYSFVKSDCSIYLFLNSAKYVGIWLSRSISESPLDRDIESRLLLFRFFYSRTLI